MGKNNGISVKEKVRFIFFWKGDRRENRGPTTGRKPLDILVVLSFKHKNLNFVPKRENDEAFFSVWSLRSSLQNQKDPSSWRTRRKTMRKKKLTRQWKKLGMPPDSRPNSRTTRGLIQNFKIEPHPWLNDYEYGLRIRNTDTEYGI